MGLVDSLRDKLDAKVFNKLASSATLVVETVTYNDYGDKVLSSATSTTVSLVPFNFYTGRLNYQAFGTLNEGESDVIIRYDSVIDVKDRLILDGTEYEVKVVEDYYLLNDSIAKAVRITKVA